MSDDLVKQALVGRIKEHDAAFTNLHREYDRRGDRIEELIEEGSVMAQKLDAAEAKLSECEARLEKALEALRQYACDCGYACEQLNGTCGDTARAALLALEENKLDEPLHRHTWNPPTNFGSKEE